MFDRSNLASRSFPLWPQIQDVKGDVKVLYNSQKEYEQITARLHMLREWRVRACCRSARVLSPCVRCRSVSSRAACSTFSTLTAFVADAWPCPLSKLLSSPGGSFQRADCLRV